MARTRNRRCGGRSPFGSRLLGSLEQSPRALRLRVQLLLTGLLITTNVIGAGIVFVISSLVLPQPPPTFGTILSLAIAVPVYVLVAVIVGAAIGTSTSLRALRWVSEEREPDETDRRRTLAVPLRLTQMQGVLWISAAVLFTALAVFVQPERAASTGIAVVIAGAVVCAVAYLFTQFGLRPVAARALTSEPLTTRPRGVGVGDRMVIFWSLGTGVPVLGVVVSAILAITTDDTSTTQLAVVVIVLSGVILIFGMLVTVLNARSVVAPVLSVRDAMLRVERGDLDRTVPVYDGTELGMLQAGFNRMAAGLRDRERLRDLFGRHVGQEVAEAAASREIELGGESRTVSVLFVDLVGSTGFATEHDPTEVVDVLNRFFGVVVDEVDRRSGLVNKFLGDAVLAVFGAPVEHEDHRTAALAAGRVIASRLAAEVPEIGAGVGIACGEVVAGNVGHQSRFEYTVTGDAVNSASRITDLAKDVEGRLLATALCVEGASDDERARWRSHGSEQLRGRSEPTELSVPADPA